MEKQGELKYCFKIRALMEYYAKKQGYVITENRLKLILFLTFFSEVAAHTMQLGKCNWLIYRPGGVVRGKVSQLSQFFSVLLEQDLRFPGQRLTRLRLIFFSLSTLYSFQRCVFILLFFFS